jgi:two-component sensor histidine kinase
VKTALRVLALAAAYYLAGRLALLMAIPPGYATAVWPAAGIALAVVLSSGGRVAPGILIGSFLVNVGTSFDSSSLAGIAASVAVAVAIAGGATLQALAGAALIRRGGAAATNLEEEADIRRFALLAAPLACIVSPLIGVTTLSVAHIVPWSSAPFGFATWWVGDTIGVLIFAPFTLTLIGEPRAVWRRRRRAIAIPAIIGIAATTVIFVKSSGWEQARLRHDFERRAAPLGNALGASLDACDALVQSAVSFFDASRDVTAAEFGAFVEAGLRRNPSIRGLSFGPRILDGERAAFEETARDRGFAGFEIKERGPDGTLRRAAQRSSYVPLLYLEPGARSGAIRGFDLASDPARRSVLDDRPTGRSARATPPVPLAREAGGGTGILLAAAVVNAGTIAGYVIGVLRVDDVIATARRGLDAEALELTLIDEVGPAGSMLLHADGERAGPSWWSAILEFGGRRWRLEVRPTPGFLHHSRSWQAWLVLAVGLLCVGLLGIVTLVTTGRAARVEEEVVRAAEAEAKYRDQQRLLELGAALREKEILLKEIHHRVKNNLQVISSLLNLQGLQVDEPESRARFEQSRARIHAISMVHERLYQARDLAHIDFDEYVRTLVENLLHAHDGARRGIAAQIDVAPVPMSVDVAIPCGLIISELVTNSLKYAFVGDRTGSIRIALRPDDGGRLALTVADDGVGLPAEIDPRQTPSLGLDLVFTFAAQLEAEVEVERARGTAFHLRFAAGGA